MADDERRVAIAADVDIVVARQTGRHLAEQLGFSLTDLTLIATAVSEVARNIASFAGTGEIIFSVVRENGRQGIEVVARDQGPGIPDIERALKDGYSTSRGMGLGLPGARRLMDDFELSSTPGSGTTVVMRKWVSTRG